MIKNKIKLLLLLLILLSSCQAVKDGLTGKKNNNSDEFLVKKKNPLELPPDFDELPAPKKNEENIFKTYLLKFLTPLLITETLECTQKGPKDCTEISLDMFHSQYPAVLNFPP